MTPLTIASIQTIIANNNGTLSTSDLAKMLGKDHTRLCEKLSRNVTLDNLSTVEEAYNSDKNTRTVYLLPEAEAMALAMSYDMNLGMQVYQAFKAYEQALQLITVTGSIEDAVSIAKTVLEIAIDEAIQNNKDGKQISRSISTALRECNHEPSKMIEVLQSISDGMRIVNTNNGREGYWITCERIINKLQQDYRFNTKHKFDTKLFTGYDTVTKYCLKRIASNRETTKNKLVKEVVMLNKKVNAASSIINLYSHRLAS
ncbi:hypothetical protein [Photobacterium phosphoreum]|uniref:hypothetical protein n=1 Tax=Photobacterium phosphoreum TaxID=659 RepID=UPI0024BAA955|nr:hypothetical protein [Photobacterium phosphoreum]